MSRRALTLLVVLNSLLVAGALVAIALGAGSCSSRKPTSPVDGTKALAHAAEIVKLSPRPAGSQTLVACGDYIIEQLEDMGLHPQQQTFKDPKERRLKRPFRNIWVEIESDTQKPNTAPILVIGSHYDSKICSGHPDQNLAPMNWSK